MASKPIKPSQAVSLKKSTIPDEVIDAFNELIAKNLSGNYSSFTQDQVVKLIVSKGIPSNEIYENHWLDVEDIYRKEGWSVEYDKPGYNESYAASFTFKVKTK